MSVDELLPALPLARPSGSRSERVIPAFALRMAADFVMAAAAVPLAFWLRFEVFPVSIPGGQEPDFFQYVQAAPALAACLVVAFFLTGNYKSDRGALFVDELFGTLAAAAAAALIVLAAMTLYPSERFSRLTFASWFVCSAVLIGISRYVIRRVEKSQRARGIGATRALVVGNGAAASKLVQRIRMFPDFGYELVGVLTDDEQATRSANGQFLGRISDLEAVVTRHDVDTVFVALPHVDQGRLVQLVGSHLRAQVEFRIVPTVLELLASRVEPDQLAGVPLLRLRRGGDVAPAFAGYKRAFDVVASGLGLVILSPLLTVIAAAVKLTSAGPILIRQERVGRNNHRFEMLKFRSMRRGAETQSGPVMATARDDRRTVVGRVLRRFSLDELPQLWNVLRGDMSLVGPRPERPKFVSDFNEQIPMYGDRHRVRPGVTGWAQVNDLRGMTSVEDRLVYDLFYIERWSLAFDMKILLTTAFRIFTSRNAY